MKQLFGLRPLAPSTAFALDQLGSVFLVGGSAVVPSDSSLLLPLLAYLNSFIVNDFVRQTTPQFRGSFQKFEPQHLSQIPVLRRVIEDEAFTANLGDLAANAVDAVRRDDMGTLDVIDARIDELLRGAFAALGIAVAD